MMKWDRTLHSIMLLLMLIGVPGFLNSKVQLARIHEPLTTSSVFMATEGRGASSPERRKIMAAGVISGATLLSVHLPAHAASRKAEMIIKTTAGDMEFEFWPEVAPATVENFKKLARQGFFDGQAFHRIIPGFVIQGGDPNSRVGYGPAGTWEGHDTTLVRQWGRGGPGYTIKAEFNERKHGFGVLSMARSADPDSAGSQFFVCLGDLPDLDNKYTTFGKLVKGEKVLKALGAAPTTPRGDFPLQRQGIERVRIIGD